VNETQSSANCNSTSSLEEVMASYFSCAVELKVQSVSMLDGRFTVLFKEDESPERESEADPKSALYDLGDSVLFMRQILSADEDQLSCLTMFVMSIEDPEATEGQERERWMATKGAYETVYDVNSVNAGENNSLELAVKMQSILDVWPYWRNFVQTSIINSPYNGQTSPILGISREMAALLVSGESKRVKKTGQA